MHRVFHPGRGCLLPGVLALLDAVGREPEWGVALLTGNMTQMAHIKLRRFGIADRFALGAFGEEAADRNALACVAVSRVAARFGVPSERCVVVGDTVHDIECARAAGAHVIAVATGPSDRVALAAHEPDLVLDDLPETDRVIEWARGIARD